MTIPGISLARGSRGILVADAFQFPCLALAIVNAGIVASAWLSGAGPNDFVGVWAAGRLALEGAPQAAYDWSAHKAVEDLAAGFPFAGTYPWLYPPSFLMVAAVVALVPYALAHFMWPTVTSVAYLGTIRAIIQHRTAILLAAAFPGAMANMLAEQNGFLSAGLFGGALVLMERRPLLSGCLLGLLTYKPQLGLIIPLALIAGGRWRVFCSAAVVAVTVTAMSWVAFGSATWAAFGHSSVGAMRVLADHPASWHKLQTVFGLVLSLGGSESVAWSLQGGMIVACAVFTSVAWRRAIAFEVQAAALVAASLLATPYLYIYDLAVLSVPMAFLIRLGRTDGFRSGEISGLAAASLLVMSSLLVDGPVGLAAIFIITLLVARRAIPLRGLGQRIASSRSPCDGQPSTEFPHVSPSGPWAASAARLHRESHRAREREAQR
jgi:arabinofuranan 3-O-arabinosyltransferase